MRAAFGEYVITFEFATAGRIIFGAGKSTSAGEIAAGFGKRIFLVTGGHSADSAVEQLKQTLKASGIDASQIPRYSIRGEPDVPTIREGLAQAKAFQAEVIIGLGGGAAMDSAKALAALLTNPGDMLDYLEVVGKGQSISQMPLPCICIPTTAGTGSEVTRNSVIGVSDQRLKVSMRGLLMLARVALVDPELTYSLPPEVTAYTGLDALTQLVEAYLSARATVFSRAIVESALPYARHLEAAYAASQTNRHDVTARTAREAMSYAALCSGLALANSGLGAVHGFASVMGARYPIPHGLCCGILLPHTIEANYRRDFATRPHLWNNLAHLLGQTSAESLIDYLHRLTLALNLPALSTFGLDAAHQPELVALAKRANSMKANPVELNDDELTGILAAAG